MVGVRVVGIAFHHPAKVAPFGQPLADDGHPVVVGDDRLREGGEGGGADACPPGLDVQSKLVPDWCPPPDSGHSHRKRKARRSGPFVR
jgi:hypothetical protein